MLFARRFHPAPRRDHLHAVQMRRDYYSLQVGPPKPLLVHLEQPDCVSSQGIASEKGHAFWTLSTSDRGTITNTQST